MNKHSSEQSRKNSRKHKRKIEKRHNKAGKWQAQDKPMFHSGTVHYEIGSTNQGMSYGGISAIHRMVVKLGLRDEIDKRLHLLKIHLPYHESDHVLNMAYNIMCGGTRLEDIERLRHDVAYMNALNTDLIPDPTTAGDFTRRFDETDILILMDAINAVRAKLWAGRGRDLLGEMTYVDVDGTIAPTYGECKEGMDISYKGIWGYAPLIVSLANTKEVLYIVNRSGNAPSHKGAAEWIDRAIDLVRPYSERICLRGDTDFSLTANFDKWAARVDFIFGMDAHKTLCGLAENLPENDWRRLEREPRYETVTDQTRDRKQENHKERIVRERGYENIKLRYEDVAEFEYRPGKCKQPYRMVVVRKNISRMKGDDVLFDEIRYFFYVTTRRDLTVEEIVRQANKRCDQENVIEQLKNGVNALRMPMYDMLSNWAYMIMATLAWNLKSWFSMMTHLKSDRGKYAHMEFRRFMNEIILIPCQVIRRARSIIIRLTGYRPSVDLFFSTFQIIERIRFT